MSIRPISKTLQEKAEKELNEVPSKLHESLQHIKEWLAKQPHIKYKNDDQLLVNFIRSSKYSLERTKKKLDAYYTFRTLAPEIAKNLDPFSPDIQAVLATGLCVPLPIPKNSPADSRVYLIRHAPDYDPDIVTYVAMLKVAAIAINLDINNSDNFVISGGKAIWDLKGLQLKTAAQITPTLLRKTIYLLQSCYPSRVKSVHLINIPKYMEPPLNMLKLLAPKKFTSRFYFHTSNNLDEVFKEVPRHVFPTEYGGEAGSFDQLRDAWKKEVEGFRDSLMDEDNYYSDESKRPGEANTPESVFGIEGSFRKLEVD